MKKDGIQTRKRKPKQQTSTVEPTQRTGGNSKNKIENSPEISNIHIAEPLPPMMPSDVRSRAMNLNHSLPPHGYHQHSGIPQQQEIQIQTSQESAISYIVPTQPNHQLTSTNLPVTRHPQPET